MESKLDIINLSVDTLIPYVKNSRTHDKGQIKKIAESIREFGFNDPIAIDSDFNIIAGHARLQAAKFLGLKSVPTIQLSHLNKDQQKAYVIAHNRVALDAGWDDELLKIELHELKDAGFDLDILGFDDKEITKLFEIDISDGLTHDEEVPVVDSKVCCVDDIWILGDHRLQCGDSTNEIYVKKLCKEFNPILMVTDPPYGVNYDAQWREELEGRYYKDSQPKNFGKVENDNICEWSDSYKLFTGNVSYVWCASVNVKEFIESLNKCDFEIKYIIVWVKQQHTLGRGDYHWQHELCLYAVRNGQKHNWQGARDQSTVWKIDNNNPLGENNPEETFGHSTQKPLECMSRAIINNSKQGEYVYDPFGGTGTTLIACEKYKRKCLMIEIMPNYCDIIIKRWEKYTGKQAILESNNKTYDLIKNEGR